MKALRRHHAAEGQRGAALLLTFLVLIVILMIVYQVSRITTSEHIGADRSLTETRMNLAIQAAFLENEKFLVEDAEQSAGGEDPMGDGETGTDGEPPVGDGGEGEGPAEESGPSDSMMDSWATAQQSTIAEVDVITLIEDEDRKYNVLGMLVEDEEEAAYAEAIVGRILDKAREGTLHDIDSGTAMDMAQAMRRYLTDRASGTYPTPNLVGLEPGLPIMPLSLREFMAVPPFAEHHFRDFFDERDNRVHSIEHFLTIYTSPTVGQSESSEFGYAVNVNTASLVVLSSLFDAREIDPRVWLDIVEYRTTEQEPDPDEDPDEAEFRQDRFNGELLKLQFFDSLDTVEELPTMADMDPEIRNTILARLKVTSQVFSITIMAKKSTLAESNSDMFDLNREEIEKEEQAGTNLVRTVRRVLWRQAGEESTVMHTLMNWEVLDFVPLEVLDGLDR